LRSVNLKVLESSNIDPWWNLALEEYLLATVHPQEIILFLWQNNRTVVIGANQNPWKECNIKLLEEDGGKLARRLSGGGAVYHDLGNLNFTFVLSSDHYDFGKQIRLIVDALAQHGLKAQFTGRNDIVIDGKKISGNAYYQDGDKFLHHGTILLDCDFNQMSRYLQVSDKKIQSKGIDSVKSRVANIREWIPEITIDCLKQSVKKQFENSYGSYDQISYSDLDKKKIDILYIKYSSNDWRFGNTPEYFISFTNYFHFGEITLNLNVDQGTINAAQIYSDVMDVKAVELLKAFFIGLSFDHQEMEKRFHSCHQIHGYKDFITWIIHEIKNM
jgi:lipoate-protein ligase A